MMRVFGKWLGRVLLLLVLAGFGMWLLGPYERVELTPSFDDAVMGDDLDAYFARVEGAFDDITPGVEKRVVWAGEAGAKTEWAVLYVHGFSATSEEIRPVPDMVAAGLEANLVYTRLAGHGRSGAAMAEPSAGDWMNDLAEALAAARRVGERVLVISTSTGGTVVAAAAQDAGLMEQVSGLIFVSPNFGLNNPLAWTMTLPGARYYLPAVFGSERNFEPSNEAHGTYWTTRYPSVAIFPMAALVKVVVGLDHSKATVPALFWYSEADQVVDPALTTRIAAQWGGASTSGHPDLTDGDDPYAHVIAGAILSPAQNEPTAAAFLDWARGL